MGHEIRHRDPFGVCASEVPMGHEIRHRDPFGVCASEVPMGHEIRHRDPFGVCASVLVYRGSVTESLRVRNCTAPGSRYPVNLELLPSGKCFSPRT